MNSTVKQNLLKKAVRDIRVVQIKKQRLKNIFLMLFVSLPLIAGACPEGQYNQCILPSPWGCKSFICVPTIQTPRLPSIDISLGVNQAVQQQSNVFASQGVKSNSFSNRDGCILFVTGALTAWGASYGGPIGATVSGGVGLGAAIISCNKWFPQKEDL